MGKDSASSKAGDYNFLLNHVAYVRDDIICRAAKPHVTPETLDVFQKNKILKMTKAWNDNL